MDRRTFLGACLAGISSTAGCVLSGDADPSAGSPVTDATPAEGQPGGSGMPGSTATATPLPGPRMGADLPADPDPDDGFPPLFDRYPEERAIETDGFETIDVEPKYLDGNTAVSVPLAPIDACYYWYARGEARFVDARAESQYELAHVLGAVASPALEDLAPAIEDWPTADRVVCYCGCPHSLSSIRAAKLLEADFESVYALDEGFQEWFTRDYPMAGSHLEDQPSEYLVEGVTDPAAAGERAAVTHEPTGQFATARIRDDGTYAVGVRFRDVTIESVVVVETPAYSVETTIRDALGDPIEPPSA